MKNISKLFGIIIFVMVMSFAFFACDNGNGRSENQTPVADDFNISGIGTFFAGIEYTVTITPKENKSNGAITVYYNSSTIAPSTKGTYSVTFDVADSTGFNAVQGLSAGTLTIDFGVYGKAVTGGELVTQTRVDIIKKSIDDLEEHRDINYVNFYKSDAITEFKIVASGTGNTRVGTIVEIGVDAIAAVIDSGTNTVRNLLRGIAEAYWYEFGN